MSLTRIAWRGLVLVSVLCAAACSRAGFDFLDGAGPGEGVGSGEGAPGRDRGQPLEVGADDARRDGPSAPKDQGPASDKAKLPDKTVAPLDWGQAPDKAMPPDKGKPPDLPLGGPCGGTATVVFSYTPEMVICGGASTGPTQCYAHKLCNTSAGWHLCAASEFKAAGGVTKPASVVAWIAGCSARAGAGHSAVADGVCGGCFQSLALDVDAAWPCSGGTATYVSGTLTLAVVTHSVCQRVGVNQANEGAYWQPLLSNDSTVKAAVCCK